MPACFWTSFQEVVNPLAAYDVSLALLRTRYSKVKQLDCKFRNSFKSLFKTINLEVRIIFLRDKTQVGNVTIFYYRQTVKIDNDRKVYTT